jgi:hypothetical protein
LNRVEVINEYLAGQDSNALLADGLEAAIIGVTCGQHEDQPRVVYDVERVCLLLEDQGMTREEAREWFDFNIIAAWVGPGTPLYMDAIGDIEAWFGGDGPD